MMPDNELKVYCSICREWIASGETTFVDIAEDIEGRDLVTFVCHRCQTRNTSLVRN